MIKLVNAQQNNLKNISLEIPKNKFIVITGVSGSGKSSLAFDIINKEGQRLFLINQSAQARKYLGKLQKPKVDKIEGLTPTISIAQKTSYKNIQSTVGTLTEIYDSLRLLFSRLGHAPNIHQEISRSLFSFNSPIGACSHCQGLGIEDQISVDLLIEDEQKTIREGCFKITNPDGYIIYSQVRMEELDKVCQANGFSVDIPWKNLSDDQKDIVLNGSHKIKILYGKHSLESRMKWTGIKANPREAEFYKGILPVMNEILRRDRNPNILRFSLSQKCSECKGSRLNSKSLEVTVLERNIFELSQLSLSELKTTLDIRQFPDSQKDIAKPIIQKIQSQIKNLELLGLEYLSLNRSASSLSAGEVQSIRLAQQINSKLNNITYVFDEPSVGLHPSKNKNVIGILKRLVAKGNTVIVVEHDAKTIKNADWIIEIGPKAGTDGGELLFNGSRHDFFSNAFHSSTKDYLLGKEIIKINPSSDIKPTYFSVSNAEINNLKNINVRFQKQALNIVTGVSGAGKSSLIFQTLIPLIKNKYSQQLNAVGSPKVNDFDFEKLIILSQAPIGKTARSTPATYTKLFDLIRDFFAMLPEAKEQKLKKSFFSFNNKGGRCETCEGAGKITIGMHLLGNVESLCPSCEGQRFQNKILNIKYQNKNISDVLKMTVKEAQQFFKGQKKIEKHLSLLDQIGLSYLKLGQSSNTLSGGEAQRIRLVSELVKEKSTQQLFIFDEPTTGLHFVDIQRLLKLFELLIQKGNTIILIEHNEDVIKNAARIIDLGPGSAKAGGELVFEGNYKDFLRCKKSITAQSLSQDINIEQIKNESPKEIEILGAQTHNLKKINVHIPYNQHTVVVGKSGSGKSSLVFDTIFSEAQNSFIESFPSYIQQFARIQSNSKVDSINGLRPSIALKQNQKVKDRRSTIGTLTGINDNLRLLFSRFGTAYCPNCGEETNQDFCKNCNIQFIDTKKASSYSFNHIEGVCQNCKGLGEILSSSPELLVENHHLPLSGGALFNNKLLKSYVDVNEKYMATLLAVGKAKGIDFTVPFNQLNLKAKEIAFYGIKDEIFDVEWKYKTKTKEGIHQFSGPWVGFIALLLDEYYRRFANGKGSDLMPFMTYKSCPYCKGKRFKKEILNVRFNNKNISELSNMSISNLIVFFSNIKQTRQTIQVIENIQKQLESLNSFNLGYLHLDRKSNTLSGGELQRVFLSSHLKGSLTGLCYILDEPSSGLHPADILNISNNIKKLVDNGNTVITVEHQKEVIKSADYIVELGPDSGEQGGHLLFEGSASLFKNKATENRIDFSFDKSSSQNKIEIKKAKIHNLQSIDVNFLINHFNVISGLSGSGKTSLLRDVLLKSKNTATNCDSITGLNQFSEILWLDRYAMEKSEQSSLASYLGLIDDIKKIFTPLLKGTKLKANQFSYNNKVGQCHECKGKGYIQTKMDFLSDVRTICETCKGKRYKSEVLEIKYNEKSIADILEMNVLEALQFFKDNKTVIKKLRWLKHFGLSYLKLGQSSHEFSGGESQRIKICRELISSKPSSKLFIFDEASRGLHSKDLIYLLQTFKQLIIQGHTVIAIEHNTEIIKYAQHIVDLHLGKVLFEGSIEGLKQNRDSYTARYL